MTCQGLFGLGCHELVVDRIEHKLESERLLELHNLVRQQLAVVAVAVVDGKHPDQLGRVERLEVQSYASHTVVVGSKARRCIAVGGLGSLVELVGSLDRNLRSSHNLEDSRSASCKDVVDQAFAVVELVAAERQEFASWLEQECEKLRKLGPQSVKRWRELGKHCSGHIDRRSPCCEEHLGRTEQSNRSG